MQRDTFTVAQIIGILTDQEAGVPVAGPCRKHKMSGASFYEGNARHGGLNY